MGYSVFPLPSASSPTLNRSQVFTSSGNFTVPADVSFVHVRLRGGNGEKNTVSINGGDNVSASGTAGTASSVFSISAAGGTGSYVQAVNSTSGRAYGMAETNGAELEFFYEVTPAAVHPVTVGTGVGAYAIISWSEA